MVLSGHFNNFRLISFDTGNTWAVKLYRLLGTKVLYRASKSLTILNIDKDVLLSAVVIDSTNWLTYHTRHLTSLVWLPFSLLKNNRQITLRKITIHIPSPQRWSKICVTSFHRVLLQTSGFFFFTWIGL